MFSKKLATISIAAITAIGIGPAFAGETVQTQSVAVDTSGYDLTTDEGSDTIVRKIENAAEKVCGARKGAMTLSERTSIDDCVNDAVEGALASLAAERQRQAALKADQAG